MIKGIDRARRRLIAAAVLTAATGAMPAQAAWPEKPVRIVLPFGAGGIGDVTARIVAEKLSTLLGQRFNIENMPGPAGIIAARAVINAAPDGYTLGLLSNGTAASVATFKKLPFDPLKDFAMVSTMGQFDAILVASSKSDFKTLGDFIKAAKANPGKFNVGTIAAGSTQNLGAEYFKSLADINIAIVPYKNSPDIVVGLLRNDVQLMLDFPPSVLGQTAAGELRLLATAAEKRSQVYPDVPTSDEQGLKGFKVYSWNAIFAPKGTPKEIIDKLNKAIRDAVAAKDVQEQFAKLGIEAHASSPEELLQRLIGDIANLNAVVDRAGIERQ